MKRVIDYYALLGVSVDASFDEIKSAHRNLVKRYHPDVYPLDDLATRERVESLIRQINEAYAILSDSKKRQSYDEEYINALIRSPASGASRGTETGFEIRSALDMSVFRKVWLFPIPFFMAMAVSSIFWNLGQITGTAWLGGLTAVVAYPLIIVLLLRRLSLPILHKPVLDIKQKLACLPLIIVSVIFAGCIWSILVDHHLISSMWNLCWWSVLIGITCGLLACL